MCVFYKLNNYISIILTTPTTKLIENIFFGNRKICIFGLYDAQRILFRLHILSL